MRNDTGTACARAVALVAREMPVNACVRPGEDVGDAETGRAFMLTKDVDSNRFDSGTNLSVCSGDTWGVIRVEGVAIVAVVAVFVVDDGGSSLSFIIAYRRPK